MISCFLAESSASVCTGPFDLVKTKLMAQSISDNVKHKGMTHAIGMIYAEEGLLPRLMRIPPGQAIM